MSFTTKQGVEIEDKKTEKPAKLTLKQKRFALGKVGGLSTKQAGLTAGYSKSLMEDHPERLEKHVGIKSEIVSIFDRIGLTSEKLSKIEKKGLMKATIIKDGKEVADYRVRLGYAKHIRELRGELVPMQITQNVVQLTPQQAKSKLNERLEAIEKAQKPEDLTHKDHPPEKELVTS